MVEQEIEVDDSVARDLEELRAAHPDWDDEKFWSIVLWDGVDLTRYYDEQCSPEGIAAQEREDEAAAEERRREASWIKTVHADIVRSAELLRARPDQLDEQPEFWRRGLRFDVSLAPEDARAAAWLEIGGFGRFPAELRIDLGDPEHREAAQKYVREWLFNELSQEWSELLWRSHPILFRAGREK